MFQQKFGVFGHFKIFLCFRRRVFAMPRGRPRPYTFTPCFYSMNERRILIWSKKCKSPPINFVTTATICSPYSAEELIFDERCKSPPALSCHRRPTSQMEQLFHAAT
jgi:hypothetical protein